MRYSSWYNSIFLLFTMIFVLSFAIGQNIDEGFEGAFPPVGWHVLQSDCGAQVYWWQTDGEYDVCNGNYAALILGSDVICGRAKDWLVTPQLTPTTSDYILSFNMHQSYLQEHGSIFTLRVSTTSAVDTNDFIIFKTWNENQMPTNCTITNIDFTPYIGDSIYIAFVMENDAGDNWIIDDVTGLPLVGNCYPPTGLETFDVISSSAGLIWEGIDTVPQFYWEVVPKGNDENTGIVVSDYSVDTFDTATGLAMSSDYDYRLRSLCSVGDTSYYSYPFSFTTLGPPPSNDECLDAVELTVNSDNSCSNIYSGTNLDATKSFAGCTGIANDDVWYKFVATSDRHDIQITNVTVVKGLSIDLVHEVFEGSCTSLSSLLCSDDNFSTLSNLTIGQTYFLRVYSKYDNSNQSFDICIKTPPPVPVNDECEFSKVAPINSDENCINSVSGTTLGATQSLQGCIGTANDDVWFSFEAASVKHTIKLNNVVVVNGSNANMVHEIFSGDCNSLTSIKCSDPNTSSVTGLIVGDTYYVRVYSKYNCCSQSFDLCILTPPPPPLNDICLGALSINVGENTTCLLNKVTCTTKNATNTMYGSCDNNGDDPDLWYSFTVPIDGDYSFSSILGNPGITLYKGTCNNLVEIACLNNTNGVLPELETGITYYARIFTDVAEQNVEFCIEKDLSPENNYCSGAILLTVGNGYCDALTIGSNLNASNSNTSPQPNCGNYNGGDIWYKLIMPASGNVEIEMSRIGNFQDGAMAIYSGSCENLSIINCDDNSNSNQGTNYMPHISLTNRSPGETVYIRVWEYDNNEYGDFSICAWEPNDLVLSDGGDCLQGNSALVNNAEGNVYTWVPLKDFDGDLIAFVYPNGNELGIVTPTVFTRTTLPLRYDANGTKYINRDIQIGVENQPVNNNPKIKLLYKNSELNDLIQEATSVSTLSDMRMTKSEQDCSGNFNPPGTLFYQESNNTVNSNGDSYLQFSIPNFSTFYVHGGNISLPLDIKRFSGISIGETNKIIWKIEGDNNIEKIILVRSDEFMNDWKVLSKIDDNFSSNNFYIDSYPFSISNYRLKIVFVDGNFVNSQIIQLFNKKIKSNNFNVKLYPNPSTGMLNIHVFGKSVKKLKVLLYDINGKLLNIKLKQLYSSIDDFTLDMSGYKTGVYLSKIISNETTVFKRFVIVK